MERQHHRHVGRDAGWRRGGHPRDIAATGEPIHPGTSEGGRGQPPEPPEGDRVEAVTGMRTSQLVKQTLEVNRDAPPAPGRPEAPTVDGDPHGTAP